MYTPLTHGGDRAVLDAYAQPHGRTASARTCSARIMHDALYCWPNPMYPMLSFLTFVVCRLS